MQILEILRSGGGDKVTNALADKFGLEPSAATDVSAQLVQDLSLALERNTLNRGGIADLIKIVGQGDYEHYLDENTDLASPQLVKDGNAVLAQVLGSKHQSRGLAARAARKNGIETGKIEKILPIIAAMMMGGIERNSHKQIANIAQRVHGLGTDGSTADETMLAPQQPLPLPRDDVEYSTNGHGGNSTRRSPFDDLSDVIRRGGYSLPGGQSGTGGVNGSALGKIVREIFGNVLGFQSKGIMGWIIRLIVFRWGASIAKAVFRRIFLGR